MAMGEDDDEDDDEYDDAPRKVVLGLLVMVDRWLLLLGRGEGHTGVGRDDVRYLLGGALDGGAVLRLLEIRLDAAQDVADLGVV